MQTLVPLEASTGSFATIICDHYNDSDTTLNNSILGGRPFSRGAIPGCAEEKQGTAELLSLSDKKVGISEIPTWLIQTFTSTDCCGQTVRFP